MSRSQLWEWTALFFLGAWHGINPGMGWLFAVALGVQKKSGRAVWQSLLPIATGHFLATGLIVILGVFAGAMIPFKYTKIGVAVLLFGFGLYRLFTKAHPKWSGKQVSFRDLAFWSFLMASAHGAGLMLLPILLGMSALNANHEMHHHTLVLPNLQTGLIAVTIHTFGYLLFTGATAWVVYKQVGVALLQKAGLNLDLVWAYVLIATAGLMLLLPLR